MVTSNGNFLLTALKNEIKLKHPVYEFSLHFRKSRYRFPDYSDDNTANTYTHKTVTVLANLETVSVKKYNFNGLHPAAFYRLSSNREAPHRLKNTAPYLPPDYSASYHMTKSWFRLWKIAQMSKLSLFGGAFVPLPIKKISRRSPVIANAEKLNVIY